jgi:acyl-CoA thioesterase FadM
VMGAAQRLTQRPGAMTGRLTLRYRRPTPLDTDLLFRAWIEDDRSRRVLVRAACYIDGVDQGPPTAEAEAIFVRRAR